MPKEKRVKDLMSPVGAYPSVYPDATLGQVLTTIILRGRRGEYRQPFSYAP